VRSESGPACALDGLAPGGQQSLINHLRVYYYKNVREWSYQVQSAWSHFSSIWLKSFLKTAKCSTSGVVHLSFSKQIKSRSVDRVKLDCHCLL